MHSYLTNLCLEFDERFKNHVATLEQASDTLQRLTWGNRDGSSVFQCVYVLDTSRGATLTITGDLFNGVFRWGEPQGWRFFRDINFDYFMEKCRAADCSCLGRKGRSWDSFAALRKLDSTWREELPGDVYEDAIKALSDDGGATAYQWEHFLHGLHGTDRVDTDTIIDLLHIGLVYPNHVIGAWHGLRLATRQVCRENQ